jgi:hypothetical protein
VAETANGCLVLLKAGTTAERQKPRAEELEKTFQALLLSVPGELFSLDKDLSWKSRTRKLESILNGYGVNHDLRLRNTLTFSTPGT